jgi:hypothetical protein
MPTPTWLSRLELDLVKARRMSKRRRKRQTSSSSMSGAVATSEKEEMIGGTEPPLSAAGASDAAETTTTTIAAAATPSPVKITGTGSTAAAAADDASTEDASTPLLSVSKDPRFDRVHLHNARLGELLVPVRIARTESEPLFGPKSPTNRHLRKVLGSSVKTAEAEQVARALKENPYPLSRDVILSPKKWKVAHNDVEPVGWYNPFADRFPNQINVGRGRDFTRVPAKFPGLTKADREANFVAWLKEKKEQREANRRSGRQQKEDLGHGPNGAEVVRDHQGLTPAERRGDVELTDEVKKLLKEKKREGEFAFKEWEERKKAFLKQKREEEERKGNEWKEMAKRHHEIKREKVRKKRKKILEYRIIQAHRKSHGPPGHVKRKNPLAQGGKKLRPVSAASTGVLIDLQRKDKAEERSQQRPRTTSTEDGRRKRRKIPEHKLNQDEIHHL